MQAEATISKTLTQYAYNSGLCVVLTASGFYISMICKGGADTEQKIGSWNWSGCEAKAQDYVHLKDRECGAEEQTVDHVLLQCPIHQPPHGLHGLTVLDNETIEWLLNTCPEIECGQAVD